MRSAYWSKALLRNSQASPRRIATTPLYIGFRVNRQSPRTTKSFGGSNGAKVPRPAARKSQTQHSNTPSPSNPRETAGIAPIDRSDRANGGDPRRIRHGM